MAHRLVAGSALVAALSVWHAAHDHALARTDRGRDCGLPSQSGGVRGLDRAGAHVPTAGACTLTVVHAPVLPS